MSTTLSLQMNINLGDIGFNEATHSFSNMVLPVAYIKVVSAYMSFIINPYQLIIKRYFLHGGKAFLMPT